jgi:hypothetical protein
MKVVCIDDDYPEIVTLGKIYEIIGYDDNNVVYIIDNNGREVAIGENRFKPLDEIRLEKIEDLLK